MNIAIIGYGNVGEALGRRWGMLGHEVTYGARDPKEGRARAAALAAGAHLTSVAEAVAGAEMVVLAVPYDAVPDAIAEAGDLAGKVVIDATNALSSGYRPAVDGYDSGAARVAALAPDARVVKAFNTLGAGMMGDLADLDLGGKAVAPICGDDPGAKAAVTELAEQTGFEVVDVGPLEAAPLVEAAALLWITLAYKQGMGPDWAFGILRRSA